MYYRKYYADVLDNNLVRDNYVTRESLVGAMDTRTGESLRFGAKGDITLMGLRFTLLIYFLSFYSNIKLPVILTLFLCDNF